MGINSLILGSFLLFFSFPYFYLIPAALFFLGFGLANFKFYFFFNRNPFLRLQHGRIEILRPIRRNVIIPLSQVHSLTYQNGLRYLLQLADGSSIPIVISESIASDLHKVTGIPIVDAP